MEESETCPYCGANRIIRKGHRKTKTLGIRHICQCKACRRKHTAENRKPHVGQLPEPPGATSGEEIHVPEQTPAAEQPREDGSAWTP